MTASPARLIFDFSPAEINKEELPLLSVPFVETATRLFPPTLLISAPVVQSGCLKSG
jgi:hypothetical protein